MSPLGQNVLVVSLAVLAALSALYADKAEAETLLQAAEEAQGVQKKLAQQLREPMALQETKREQRLQPVPAGARKSRGGNELGERIEEFAHIAQPTAQLGISDQPPAMPAMELRPMPALNSQQQVNLLALLNEGTAADLAVIPHIGSRRAAALISARPFESLGQIRDVAGIGKRTSAAIMDYGARVPQVHQRLAAAAN